MCFAGIWCVCLCLCVYVRACDMHVHGMHVHACVNRNGGWEVGPCKKTISQVVETTTLKSAWLTKTFRRNFELSRTQVTTVGSSCLHNSLHQSVCSWSWQAEMLVTVTFPKACSMTNTAASYDITYTQWRKEQKNTILRAYLTNWDTGISRNLISICFPTS